MNSFTIADIENLTNIKAHTIRMWEQRYGLCSCKRKQSNHRYYDCEDLKHILRIASLYHSGHKISQIACLSSEEIRDRALGCGDVEPKHEAFINRLLEASIDTRPESFNETLLEISTQLTFEQEIVKIIFPFLRKLGLFWLTGRVIPGQEHFASSLISKRIQLKTNEFPVTEHHGANRRVLLFTPSGEYHEIPLLYMKYLLRKHKVPLAYLGASVALEVLQEYVSVQPVTQLYFHIITNLTGDDMETYLQQLGNSFPEQQIIASGLCCLGVSNLPKNVRVLHNNDELAAFAKNAS